MPFLGQLECYSFEDVLSFGSQHAVCGDHKGNERTALLAAWVQVYPFLFMLVSQQHFFWVLIAIRLGIQISDSHVNDAILATLKKTPDENISSPAIIGTEVKFVRGVLSCGWLFVLCRVGCNRVMENQWFDSDCAVGHAQCS